MLCKQTTRDDILSSIATKARVGVSIAFNYATWVVKCHVDTHRSDDESNSKVKMSDGKKNCLKGGGCRSGLIDTESWKYELCEIWVSNVEFLGLKLLRKIYDLREIWWTFINSWVSIKILKFWVINKYLRFFLIKNLKIKQKNQFWPI